MNQTKVLLTGGCSFSDAIRPGTDTWPIHLSNYLKEYKHVHTGMGSQGNGLISRKILYNLLDILESHSPADVLVGIMWSSPERYEHFSNDYQVGVMQNFRENPTNFTGGQGAWKHLTPNLEDDLSSMYYKYWQNELLSLVQTYEHILRVQWFLKLHNIKYFMTFAFNVFKNHTNPECKYLYNEIDWTRFLPVNSQLHWCKLNSNYEFLDAKHPSSEQHLEFTQQVILPFLKL